MVQYQKDHKMVNLNNFQEAIETIINSFPTEETQSLCRETFTLYGFKEKISLLRKIDEETFEILKKKIDQWVKIFTNE